MQSYNVSPVSDPCRRVSVDPCAPATALPSSTNPTMLNANPLAIRKGDVLDVGIDWTEWLKHNGGKSITSSVWAAHASSPAAPVISSQGVFATREAVAVLDTSAAVIGDVYWLQNTVVVDSPSGEGYTLPARTVTRILAVKVSA